MRSSGASSSRRARRRRSGLSSGSLHQGCQGPGFAQAMKLQGTRVAFLDAKEYAAFLDKIDAESKTIMADLGLMKK